MIGVIMNKRKREDDKLYKITRSKAIERDKGLCVICGAIACEVHHIVYRSHLGTSILSNLACLCLQCHSEAHGVNAKEIRKHLLEVVKVE